MKHVPQRSCIVCRQSKDKSELVRIVQSADGTLSVDATGKAQGRGAYVCKSDACIADLTKKRALSRAFKRDVPQQAYDEITKALKDLKEKNE